MKGFLKKFKSDAGVAIGIVAIFINVITLSVYMYQAHIMRKQQHASAWPYMEWLINFNEETGLKLEVKNNGVGPAIVKDVNMLLKNQSLPIDSLFIKLIGTDYFPHQTAQLHNRVLPAGGSIRLFQISDTAWTYKIYKALQDQKFELRICYESIYEEQWVCSGTKVKEGACSQLTD